MAKAIIIQTYASSADKDVEDLNNITANKNKR